jgi:hypothetical protein
VTVLFQPLLLEVAIRNVMVLELFRSNSYSFSMEARVAFTPGPALNQIEKAIGLEVPGLNMVPIL